MLGAAVQANALAGNAPDGDDAAARRDPAVARSGDDGRAGEAIPRNATIPAAKAQDFTTFKDGQTALVVHVVQGERELVS